MEGRGWRVSGEDDGVDEGKEGGRWLVGSNAWAYREATTLSLLSKHPIYSIRLWTLTSLAIVGIYSLARIILACDFTRLGQRLCSASIRSS